MRRSAVVALILAAGAARARAFVISADELAERSLIAGVVARAFSFLLGGEVLRPPYVAEDASPSAQGLFDLRPYLAWRDAHWKMVLHGELSSAVRSHALAGALAIGGGAAPPRLLPLRAVLADQPTLSLTAAADWAYLAYSAGPITVTVGRQPITFGRAKVWKPTDLVGTFALTAVDTEFKPGSDAVRLDWSAGPRTQLTVVGATGELEQDDDVEATVQGTSALAQLKQGWDAGEIGLLAGLVRGDGVAAADGVWDAGAFDLYAEVVATLLTGDSLPAVGAGSGDLLLRAAAGATFKPLAHLTVSPELFYNGFGAASAGDDLAVAASRRAAIGEQILLGRFYGAAVVDWEAHPLVHLTGVALANLGDPSALLSLALSYSVADDVKALVGGYLGVGELPSPALAARSEYGLYPAFAFVELKAEL